MKRPETHKSWGFPQIDESIIFFLTGCRSLLMSARSSPHAVRGAAPGLGSNWTGRGSFVGTKDGFTTIHIARVAQG